MACFEALLDFQLIYSASVKNIEGVNVPAVLLRSEKLLASLSEESSKSAVARGRHALMCIRSVLSIVMKEKNLATGKFEKHSFSSCLRKRTSLVLNAPVPIYVLAKLALRT